MEEKVVPTTQTPIVTPPYAKKVSVPESPVETKPTTPEVNNEPEAGKADPLLDGYYKTNPFFYEVADYFNIDAKDHDVAAPKLATIVDWIINKFGVNKPEDILLQLRLAEDMVQRPRWDEKRYTNLYKYARLDAKQESIKRAMTAFQRNPNDHARLGAEQESIKKVMRAFQRNPND